VRFQGDSRDTLSPPTHYEYDGNDNLTTRTDANRRETIYTYSPYNELKTVTYPVSTNVEFFYDDAGNLTSYTQSPYSATYTYGALNRLETFRQAYPGFNKLITYSFDPFGNRKTMTDPQSEVATYEYDRLNRLDAIIHSLTGATRYTYDSANRPETKTLPNGVVTEYDFDPANRLLSLITKDPTEVVLSSFAYTHDKVGNRKTRTTPEGTTTYTYDDLYRLEAASLEGESFTYDPVGNRLTDAEGATYTHDNANRLESQNGITYNHDNNGNQISKTEDTVLLILFPKGSYE